MDNLKFVAATVSGLGICICLALFVVLLAYLTFAPHNEEPDDVMRCIGWLVAVLAACVAVYVWGQS